MQCDRGPSCLSAQLDELIEAAEKDSGYPRAKPERGEDWKKEGGLWTFHQPGGKCVWVANDAKLRTKLISEAHETPLAGHFGIKKTAERLREWFRWMGMRKEVQDFVRTCDVCQRAGDKLSDNVNVYTIVARHP